MTRADTIEAMDRADRILGKAVHPNAFDRLFELWPRATVRVEHHTQKAMVARKRLDSSPPEDRYNRQTTLVRIENPEEGYVLYGMAECAPGDQWDRKKGIALAYRRALDKVRNRVEYVAHQKTLSP